MDITAHMLADDVDRVTGRHPQVTTATIKPAEKEISFVMDLAWDINRWKPSEAHNFIRYWAAKTFGNCVAQEIADIQAGYYRLQAAGKDAHVWFVNYSAEQIEQRIAE